MNLWTPPQTTRPEIELLVRRWQLPLARTEDAARLLQAQAEGSTACALPAPSPLLCSAWGNACSMPTSTSSAQVGDPTTPTPLVMRHHEGQAYLQSWRHYSTEHEIARQLLERAARSTPVTTRPPNELVAELGPDQVNSQQAQAITVALQHAVTLITGGPGTGKTHTIARLLALLLAVPADRRPEIQLAAPTGKAAERMKEAIDAAAAQLPAGIGDDTKAALRTAAQNASTLHRLLGFNPGTGLCRYNRKTPLPGDVIIVDECSMVDTLQWHALLQAIAPSARLILLGDPHQLESVAAGDVLGSLVRFARQYPGSDLGRTWVELVDSHRFRNRRGIGALASAVVELRTDDALRLLAEHRAPTAFGPSDGLVWSDAPASRFSWDALPKVVQDALVAVADALTPTDALRFLGKVRLLTAHREHRVGVSGLNHTVQLALAKRGHPRAPNRPIIINHNDPETGLTNGSVGIVMEVNGTSAAYFPASTPDGEPRRFALGQLPEYSPAWAMTIHRSQGSEFDQIVVVLPGSQSPLATRELIYTAITRARQCVHVFGDANTITCAISRQALRVTLLEESLREQHENA